LSFEYLYLNHGITNALFPAVLSKILSRFLSIEGKYYIKILKMWHLWDAGKCASPLFEKFINVPPHVQNFCKCTLNFGKKFSCTPFPGTFFSSLYP